MLITKELVAGPTRLELATSGVTGRRSNQLNYDPASAFALVRFGAIRASGPVLAYLCKRAIYHTRKICLPSRSSPTASEGWWAVQDSNL
jgi:hypothetical protein